MEQVSRSKPPILFGHASNSILTKPTEESAQGDFFPLRTIIELPGAIRGVDAWGQVTGTDSHDYIVKGTNGGQCVPASELIGTQLAEALNLACPAFKVIELSSGELVFGSRFISNLSDQIRTSQLLTALSALDGTAPRGLTSYLSEVYAFDLFINNHDRHDHNFITIDDNGVTRFFLIDFGQSMIWDGDLMAVPGANQNTVSFGRRFRDRHGFDLESANAMLDRVASLSGRNFSAILNSVPGDWLSHVRKEMLLSFWSGEQRQEKVSMLRKGLADGSLL